MHFLKSALFALQAYTALATPAKNDPDPMSQLKDLAKQAYNKAKKDSSSPPNPKGTGNACSWKNIKIRREW